MTPLRVAAVVVTYNRSAVLAETLGALRTQTRPADGLYAVDNAGTDDTTELLRSQFPDVTHVRLAENLGPAGGLARGMEAARESGYDAFWLMDDDSAPQSDALETLITAAGRASPRAGIIGYRGGVIRFGLVRHIEPRDLSHRRVDDELFAVDFVLLDGSLVFRRVVDVVGVPPVDYFTMMQDVVYPLRAKRAGFDVLLLRRDLMRRGHLGSVPPSDLWRSYYQSRNHVRMALDLGSPALFFGCMARQVRFVVAAMHAPDRRWERIKLRSRGVWDGLRGRMGRRVEPDTAAR
jgi:rhamnopyranosyl-N-acetylglucosaminyl-diphospho-decaprenol beta-1,3/1,4-galactofuranosyltransferase